MQGTQGTVKMVRYECDVCSMSATCVATPSSRLAWLDHMSIHIRQRDFKSWTWDVVPLPLGETA